MPWAQETKPQCSEALFITAFCCVNVWPILTLVLYLSVSEAIYAKSFFSIFGRGDVKKSAEHCAQNAGSTVMPQKPGFKHRKGLIVSGEGIHKLLKCSCSQVGYQKKQELKISDISKHRRIVASVCAQYAISPLYLYVKNRGLVLYWGWNLACSFKIFGNR